MMGDFRLALALLLGLAGVGDSAWACSDGETHWLGTPTSAWDDAANWSNGLPSSTRSAVFDTSPPDEAFSPTTVAEACELKMRQPDPSGWLVYDSGSLSTGRALIGETAGSYGNMEVSAQTWSVSALGGLPAGVHVGIAGQGRLRLDNNATLSTLDELWIGSLDAGSGTVVVTGGASLPAVGVIDVGRGGYGGLDIYVGGAVKADVMYIGRLTGSSGDVVVRENSELVVNGALHVGESGDGDLSIEYDAKVTSDELVIAQLTGSRSWVSVDSYGELVVTDALHVGVSGEGFLDLREGLVSAGTTTLGWSSGSLAEVWVAGNASFSSAETMTIGYEGTASFKVYGTDSRVTTGSTTLAWAPGSLAEVHIGEYGTNASFSSAQTMTIGRSGTADLWLYADGELSIGGASQTGTLNLATLPGATGTLRLSNPGLDDGRPGALLAGEVHGGLGNATVHFDHLKAGYEFRNGLDEPIVLGGSVNVLHTRGGETRLWNSNRSGSTVVREGFLSLEQGSAGSAVAEVLVGQSAGDEAILRLLNNSILESGTAVIAQGPDSIGRASVIGAGSRWTQNGLLIIGDAGDGELLLRADSTLEADNIQLASTSGSRGVLNVGNGARPGVIRAGQIAGGGGEAVVNFNHNHPAYDLDSMGTPVRLTGSVQVNHLGVGRTRLFGNNQYLGPTLVEQGSLVLSQDALLSTPERALNVGEIDQQTGRFEMETGAQATVDILRVGRAGGSRGEIKISGGDIGSTELRTLRTMIIGGGGQADVELGQTALLVAGSGAVVGRFGPGDGQVSMSDGARWLIEDGGLTIGELGRGEVIVGNGAVLEVLDGGAPGAVVLGAEPGSDGVLRVGDGVSAGALLAASVIGGPGAGGLVFQHQHADYEFSANGAAIGLGGSMDVVHSGSGSTRLLGSQMVNGDLVAAFGGTFILNGQFVFNSFTATNGGRLSGKGMLSGPVLIEPGSRLAPGDGVGVMTIQGNLVFGGLATLEMALADTDPQSNLNARLNVNGNLRLNGQLEITGLPGFGPGRYRLINYSGMLDDLGLAIASLPPGFLISEASIDTSIPGQVDLIVGGQLDDALFSDRFESP